MGDAGTKVSVVLIVGNRRERSARALASLLAQEGIEDHEVILIDVSEPGTPPLAGSDHPIVRSHRVKPPATFGHLREEGVQLAGGEIVAFMEDHVEVKPGWLKAIIHAFEGPWAAVGAEVHNANLGVGFSNTIGVINYGRWAPPLERGEANMLAGNNTAYRRQTLLQYQAHLDRLLMSDTVLQWRLKKDGHRLLAEPNMAIDHLNPTTARSAAQAEFLYHWCFAVVRAEIFSWSTVKKLAYVLLSPVIPWLRLLRMARFAGSKGSDQRRVFLRSAVYTALMLHIAVAGQLAGLVLGERDSSIRFTDFEINGARPAS